MGLSIFQQEDLTTGYVARALGEERQNITDLIRRGTVIPFTPGSHARLSFAQATTIGIARSLIRGGMSVFVASNAARLAGHLVPGYIEMLASAGATGADPLAPGGAADSAPPVFVAAIWHDDDDGEVGVSCDGRLTAVAKVSDFLGEVLGTRRAEHRGIAPIAVVVPLLPIIRRLVAANE